MGSHVVWLAQPGCFVSKCWLEATRDRFASIHCSQGRETASFFIGAIVRRDGALQGDSHSRLYLTSTRFVALPHSLAPFIFSPSQVTLRQSRASIHDKALPVCVTLRLCPGRYSSLDHFSINSLGAISYYRTAWAVLCAGHCCLALPVTSRSSELN